MKAIKWYLKTTETASMLGVHPDTLRRWDNQGRFKAGRTPGGTRLYSLTKIRRLMKRFEKKGFYEQ